MPGAWHLVNSYWQILVGYTPNCSLGSVRIGGGEEDVEGEEGEDEDKDEEDEEEARTRRKKMNQIRAVSAQTTMIYPVRKEFN